MASSRGKGKAVGAGDLRAVGASGALDPAHLALPDEEIRRLVMRITAAGDVAPFVRRMVRVIDALKAGRPVNLTLDTRRGANPDLLKLTSALSRAVEEERFMAAYLTALLAAHYAYQNSLDYVCALFGYLDGFGRKRAARCKRRVLRTDRL